MNTNKPVLIIQLRPEDDTSDNEFQAILKYGELRKEQTRRLRIETHGIPEGLAIEDYSAIIVGGSPFDISTPNDKKPAIQHKIESDFQHLLRQVVEQDFPFLGACSGNGLLGSYLGATISQRYREPVSCVTLNITEQGKQDPLLKGFPDQIGVMLGHKEACDTLPQGATLLMTGDVCPVQMFRVGNNVYATQFHPEGDKEGFILRIEAYKHNGYFKLHEVEELTLHLSQASTPHAQQILKRFVARYYKQAEVELQLLNWAAAKPFAEQIRRTVFIEEQHVPESEEWDDEDDSSLHIVVIKGDNVVATARLTQAGKIGRMAVLKEYRKQGIASSMLVKLIEVAKQRDIEHITLWSQSYAQGFYQKHGFIANGKEFLDAGIPHIEMSLNITPLSSH